MKILSCLLFYIYKNLLCCFVSYDSDLSLVERVDDVHPSVVSGAAGSCAVSDDLVTGNLLKVNPVILSRARICSSSFL